MSRSNHLYAFLVLCLGAALSPACSAEDSAPTERDRPNTNGSGGSQAGSSNPGSGGTRTGTGGSDSSGSGGTSNNSSGGTESGAAGHAETGGETNTGNSGGAELAKWKFYKELTLDTTSTGANVSEDIAKYPVAVVLNATNFDFTQAKSDGTDVRLSTIDGTALPFAIEHWDANAKLGAIWVKVDVKGNSKQSILLSWGNADATATGNSEAVFDKNDGFVGVWHLSEAGSTTAGGYKDATANAAHATGVKLEAGSVTEGRIGRAALLDHSKQQWIRVEGDKNKLFDIYNELTYSIWSYSKSVSVEYQALFTKGETGFRMHMYGIKDWSENKGKHIVEPCAEMVGGGDFCPLKGGNDNAWQGTDVAPGKWWHWVVVHKYPQLTFYLNGVQEVTAKSGAAWTSNAKNPVGIGNNTTWLDGRRSWDGYVDEARVMNVVKNASFAKLEYESQKEGQKFVTFGETFKRF